MRPGEDFYSWFGLVLAYSWFGLASPDPDPEQGVGFPLPVFPFTQGRGCEWSRALQCVTDVFPCYQPYRVILHLLTQLQSSAHIHQHQMVIRRICGFKITILLFSNNRKGGINLRLKVFGSWLAQKSLGDNQEGD